MVPTLAVSRKNSHFSTWVHPDRYCISLVYEFDAHTDHWFSRIIKLIGSQVGSGYQFFKDDQVVSLNAMILDSFVAFEALAGDLWIAANLRKPDIS